ncbi:MAG: metallophosphoesterase [Alistipes sp.]
MWPWHGSTIRFPDCSVPRVSFRASDWLPRPDAVRSDLGRYFRPHAHGRPSDRIALGQAPAAFDGYRIALFTDLHTGTQPRNHRLIRRMVALINREHPDLVVNAGDLVNIDSHELDDRVMSILSTLHGRDGVYSVLGNHDLGFYMRPKEDFTPRQSVEELLSKQRAMGWRPLVNESAPIRRSADSIIVTGVNFPETGTNHGRDTGMAGCDMQEVFRNVPRHIQSIARPHARAVGRSALGRRPRSDPLGPCARYAVQADARPVELVARQIPLRALERTVLGKRQTPVH